MTDLLLREVETRAGAERPDEVDAEARPGPADLQRGDQLLRSEVDHFRRLRKIPPRRGRSPASSPHLAECAENTTART
jgi:hypothetical protein